MYRSLDPDRIVASLDTLESRIKERFSGAGLAGVCAELSVIARETKRRAERIKRPNLLLRFFVGLLLAGGAVLTVWVSQLIDFSKTTADSVFTVLQGIEAIMNIIVLMGAALWALITLEEKWKRRRAMAALHELRAIAHVIDMHQVTKDPGHPVGLGKGTASSPKRTLSNFELSRYLDYCSEMLSLTAKVAALYAQSLNDTAVTETVNEIEQITTNLSNKIWQKINIVQRMMAEEGRLLANQATPHG